MSAGIGVYLEVGAKRVFASAADWPGWSRSGKTEAAALEALESYAQRYAKVARLAGEALPKAPLQFEVVERLKGNVTTDFGAPGVPAKGEAKTTPRQIERLASLVEAAWRYLDEVVATAPQELRKGPRGGGRDRDKMYAHVLESEWGYSRAIGLRLKGPDRDAMRQAFGNPPKESKWPVTYVMRRIAWHALDHAWEIEDRIP